MKTLVACLSVLLLLPRVALADDVAQPTSPAPAFVPPPPAVDPPLPGDEGGVDDLVEDVPQDTSQDAPPAPPPSSGGQWIFTDDYGWVWAPYGDQYLTYAAGDASSDLCTYEYLYYPTTGWTWLAAPWVEGLGVAPYFGRKGSRHFSWSGAAGNSAASGATYSVSVYRSPSPGVGGQARGVGARGWAGPRSSSAGGFRNEGRIERRSEAGNDVDRHVSPRLEDRPAGARSAVPVSSAVHHVEAGGGGGGRNGGGGGGGGHEGGHGGGRR